jgi:hypothetical protein
LRPYLEDRDIGVISGSPLFGHEEFSIRRGKFPPDEYGFVVDPELATELRDSQLKLACLKLGKKRTPYGIAQEAVFGIVGRGWASNHRARPVTPGSTPAFFHHPASSRRSDGRRDDGPGTAAR